MDRKFLEFWGNYLLAVAKGQKQLEDMNQWIRQGFSGFQELTAMFNKFYGLEHTTAKDADSGKTLQNAAADFRKSFDAYLDLMGVVPKEKYRQLAKKYATLQERVNDQDETINVLRKLLTEEGTYQGETLKVFQDLVNKQSEAFETLMRNLAATGEDE